MASEIAVLGGGPAGAVIALRLSELGYDVVLVGVARGSRAHRTEFLTPGVAKQLSFLGLSDVIEPALVSPTPKRELRWRVDQFETYAAMQPGFLVDRKAFDANLVAAASQRNVRVLNATWARAAKRTAEGWHISCEGGEGPLRIAASSLIDATGRRGVLPKKRHRGYRLLVVHGRFRGVGLPVCVRISASEVCWAWGAPMKDGTYAAMTFLEPRDAKSFGKNLEQRFQNLISACGLLEGARWTELIGSVEACDATPFVDGDAVGSDFLKVGEACLAVDPISSAGVQIAIQSAITGAAAINTLRSDPGTAEIVREFWLREVGLRYSRHQMWSGQLYLEAASRHCTAFWQSRLAPGMPSIPVHPNRNPLPAPNQRLRLAKSVLLGHSPCIVGNRIERRSIVTDPYLNEPVAFLDGVDLTLLLTQIESGMTAVAVISAWSKSIDTSRAISVLSWNWRRGLIESMPN